MMIHGRRRILVSAVLLFAGLAVLSAQAQQPPVTSIHVKNMHCEGCAKRLRAKLYKVPNVVNVVTNVKQGVAVITPSNGKTVSPKAIWEAAEAEKFEVAKVTANQQTFDRKPEQKPPAE